KEVRGAVLAEVEASGYGAVNCCLVIPASLIGDGETFHQSYRLSVGIYVRIDLWRACPEAASDRSVLDCFGQLFAAAHDTEEEAGAYEPKTFDENASVQGVWE